MRGANLLVKSLEQENVKYIFGYPGVAICPFVDALYDSDIDVILVRNEQNAAHAASGYARANNTVGVAFATSGPGATNLITGIATAFADSIPLVCFTGQVPLDQIGSDMFQEADIIGACESFVKYSYLVKNAGDIPRIVKEAYHIANTGRKGPVLIDLPLDVLTNDGGEFDYPKSVNLRTYKPTVKGHAVQIKKVIDTLNNAKQPILCVGGGVISSGATEEIISFASKINLPIVSTLMGLGAVKSDSNLYMGMVGNNGKKYANIAMNESDVLLVVGARVADRAVSQPDLIMKDKILIHIDIDPAEIGKNAGPSIPIVGDAKNVFEELNKYELNCDFSDWLKRLNSYKLTDKAINNVNTKYTGLNPYLVIDILCKKLADDAIFISDVGQNQMIACSSYIAKGGRFITSGGMGTMGYAIPACIGAMLGEKKQVVAVCGDGSFQMAMCEFGTAKYENIPVKIIVMNNNSLGMIKEYQHIMYSNRYYCENLGEYPNIHGICAAYDMDYFSICKDEEINASLDAFLASPNPSVLELFTGAINVF